EEMRDAGMPAGSRVLEQVFVPADEEVAGKLQIAPGSDVFRLRRLRLAGGEPMGLQTAHIPGDLTPGLVQSDFEAHSLYETLEKRYGLRPDYASQKHFAVAVRGEEARLLNIEDGSPALAGERLTYLKGGRPLEWTQSIMRGDRYQIHLKLSRPVPK